MLEHLMRIVTLDTDSDSLASLQQAFPKGIIDAVVGATYQLLNQDWDADSADLLVVGARPDFTETLSLCRALREQAGTADTPLLALLFSTQQDMVETTLAAGANSCLVVPVHSNQLANMLKRARLGNRPGRHTPGSDRAQRADLWRDEGGEA